jgi:hypothetical protein
MGGVLLVGWLRLSSLMQYKADVKTAPLQFINSATFHEEKVWSI